MRLSAYEKGVIVDAVVRIDPNARIYLFGSRADDRKRGGDIDILVYSRCIGFIEKLKIKALIFEKMAEQKIDIVIARDTHDPFVKMIAADAVELK